MAGGIIFQGSVAGFFLLQGTSLHFTGLSSAGSVAAAVS